MVRTHLLSTENDKKKCVLREKNEKIFEMGEKFDFAFEFAIL